MATRTELTTYARGQTLLDTSDVADTVIDEYFNRAIQIVSSRFPWPFLEEATTVDSVVDQHNYSLPADHTFTYALVETGKKVRLRELTPIKAWTKYGDDPPSGAARAFYFYDGEMWLLEKPDSVLTYKWFYRKDPTLMTDDAHSPEWDSNYHLFLADYAIQQLWLREEDLRQASAAAQRFNEGLGDMAQFYLDQGSDLPMVWGESPDRIVQGSYYGNMPWLDGA